MNYVCDIREALAPTRAGRINERLLFLHIIDRRGRPETHMRVSARLRPGWIRRKKGKKRSDEGSVYEPAFPPDVIEINRRPFRMAVTSTESQSRKSTARHPRRKPGSCKRREMYEKNSVFLGNIYRVCCEEIEGNF